MTIGIISFVAGAVFNAALVFRMLTDTGGSYPKQMCEFVKGKPEGYLVHYRVEHPAGYYHCEIIKAHFALATLYWGGYFSLYVFFPTYFGLALILSFQELRRRGWTVGAAAAWVKRRD